MGKGQKKPLVFYLRGKKRPVHKDVHYCDHCKAGFEGKSECDEHQNKCRMKSIASGAAAAAAAAAAADAAALRRRGVRGRGRR